MATINFSPGKYTKVKIRHRKNYDIKQYWQCRTVYFDLKQPKRFYLLKFVKSIRNLSFASASLDKKEVPL